MSGMFQTRNFAMNPFDYILRIIMRRELTDVTVCLPDYSPFPHASSKPNMKSDPAESTTNRDKTSSLAPFHLAIPMRDLASSRKFYGELFGCKEGRSDTNWVDFNFFGHQLVCHVGSAQTAGDKSSNPVDGHDVPIPHFGIVLDLDHWKILAERLQQHGVEFVIEPYIRFEGEPGEQGTMFLRDPSGNALEFKGFRDLSGLFAK